MKKYVIFSTLPLILLVAGCGGNKIDITDTEFDVESCNKYFELVDCILENDTDERYTDEMRNEIRQEIKSIQDSWNSYSNEELDNICNEEIANFQTLESYLDQIGCSIN